MLQGNQVPAGNICQLIPWVITAPCLALTPVLNVDSSDIDVLNPLVGASVHGRYATVQNEASPRSVQCGCNSFLALCALCCLF